VPLAEVKPLSELLGDLRSTGIGSVFYSAQSDWDRSLEEQRQKLTEAGFGELARIATTVPRTKGQLVEFIERALSYRFSVGQILCATDQLSDEGNCVPIDWMWEIWCLGRGLDIDGMTPLSEEEISARPKEYLLKGPRGGSKTESAAALWFTFCLFCPNYSAAHSSTERPQSLKCLSYMLEWCSSPLFIDLILNTNKQLGFNVKNGSRFVILTATLDGLNKEHTISLSLDEVETFPLDLVGQAMQIPQKQVGCPYPSMVVMASTQKKPHLSMAVHIREALVNGRYRYLLWNVWDVGERCPDWRRNKLPATITCRDHPAILDEIGNYESIVRTKTDEAILQKLYAQRDALESNCLLVASCQGRLIDGTGHLAIDTLLTRIKTLTPEEWAAENLCQAPARGGSVYNKLSEQNQSEEAVHMGEGQVVYAGVDYGYVGASTCFIFMAINNAYVDVIDEYETTEAYEEDLIPLMLDYQKKYHIKEWCVDNAAVNLARKMKRAGLPVKRSNKALPKIQKIDHMAHLICSATGFRRLRFHPTKAYKVYEQMYYYGFKKNGKDPQDGDDDFCDAALYCSELIRTRVSPHQAKTNRPRPGRSLASYWGERRKKMVQ
jgi:hypothetical protein